jgi:hypothetical protein
VVYTSSGWRAWENNDVSDVDDELSSHSLGHVVVIGGTAVQWMNMAVSEWEERLNTLVTGSAVAHPRWITLMPHSGDPLTPPQYDDWNLLFEHDIKTQTVMHGGWTRHVYATDDGVSVIIDPWPDGQRRFAALLENTRLENARLDNIGAESGHSRLLTEADISELVLSPADADPDLVVILGPPDRMPTSLVWELGYSELVFLDLQWSELHASHLEIAIDDFHRRQRRFGGLDS